MKVHTGLRILMVFGTSFTGCVSATSHSFFPQFRHPLFHDSRADFPSQPTTREPSPSLEVASRPMPRCTSTFSHPLLNGCHYQLSSPSRTPDGLEALYRPAADSNKFDLRLALASRARHMLHQPKYRVNGRRFRRDCSGFVLAVLAGYGVDIRPLVNAGGNVAAIYAACKKRGLVHHHKVPSIGDLVFFSNTYDRNGDGLDDDLLTHIGIVEHVDPDGTVTFIHHVRRGVLRYKMNLFTPHTRRRPGTRKVLNHYLRVGSGGHRHSAKLTGELFQAFATIIR